MPAAPIRCAASHAIESNGRGGVALDTTLIVTAGGLAWDRGTCRRRDRRRGWVPEDTDAHRRLCPELPGGSELGNRS